MRKPGVSSRSGRVILRALRPGPPRARSRLPSPASPGAGSRWTGPLCASALLLIGPGAAASEPGAAAWTRATTPADTILPEAAAAPDPPAEPGHPHAPDIPQAPDGPLAASPLATGGSAWHHVARGAAALGALVVADAVVRDLARSTQGDAGEAVADGAKWFGTWKRSAPVYLGGAALLGVALDGGSGLRAAGAVVVGTLVGATANEVVNVGLGRHRPVAERGAFAFDPLRGHASFPSGHAAYTFALAGAIDAATEGSLPAVLAYGAAGLCSLSRIYHDRHWASDVTIGALIGMTVSRRATRAALRRFGAKPERAAEPAATEPAATEPAARAGGPGAASAAAAARAEKENRVELLAGPELWGLRIRF